MNWAIRQLETSLLPTKWFKVPFQLVQFVLFLPLAILASLYLFCKRRLSPSKDSSLIAFAKHPQWTKLAAIPRRKDQTPLPIGFSTADIQDSGPCKSQFQRTNWGNFYEKNRIDLSVLPDTLNHSERLIQDLKDLGIKHWRTSINLLPRKGERVDPKILQLYCDHFKQLIDAGIEVMVTLNHFVHPDDFDWRNPESIDRMVKYSEEIADSLYKVGIRKLLVTNEQTVFALQSHIMGKFPPHQTFNFKAAAEVLENMMRAQLKVYQILKKMHPDFEIGLTHDPIRFRHYHKIHPFWTFQEKILCHYLTEISHSAIFRFFQTGKFTLRVPFFGYHTFAIPEFADPKLRPLDFIGLQYYTDPLIRLPKGAATRVPGEKLTTYKYRQYPQGMASILEEMATLNIPIDITETGMDVNINLEDDRERILYFTRLFQSVQKALDQGINIRSLHFWTKDRSWEWAEGMSVDFSFYDEKGPRNSALWLRKLLNIS